MSRVALFHEQWVWKCSFCFGMASYCWCIKVWEERNCKQTSPIVSMSLLNCTEVFTETDGFLKKFNIDVSSLSMSSLRVIVIFQKYFGNHVISSQFHLFVRLLNRRCTLWLKSFPNDDIKRSMINPCLSTLDSLSCSYKKIDLHVPSVWEACPNICYKFWDENAKGGVDGILQHKIKLIFLWNNFKINS